MEFHCVYYPDMPRVKETAKYTVTILLLFAWNGLVLTLKLEAVHPSEISANFCQTRQHHFP
jgi:hypothetical protein